MAWNAQEDCVIRFLIIFVKIKKEPKRSDPYQYIWHDFNLTIIYCVLLGYSSLIPGRYAKSKARENAICWELLISQKLQKFVHQLGAGFELDSSDLESIERAWHHFCHIWHQIDITFHHFARNYKPMLDAISHQYILSEIVMIKCNS